MPIATWPEHSAADFNELQSHITKMLCKTASGGHSIAWRGLAQPDWTLRSTLDRHFRRISPVPEYGECLDRERAILAEFQSRALPYAGDAEKTYLEGDLRKPAVWKVMAFGRHSGLPVRVIDWTWSPWVATYFACFEHPDADGVLWWFNQSYLKNVLHKRWDKWKVPTRAEVYGCTEDKPEQRALEQTAYDVRGPAWLTKLHYRLPFPRMEAQQAFMTACGRILKDHNEAIDDLPNSASIGRGRIRIPAEIKGDVITMLKLFNVHAKGLQFPGIDIVARDIASRTPR